MNGHKFHDKVLAFIGTPMNTSACLAVNGGNSVRRRSWPLWPRATESTHSLIREVLSGTGWAVSGQSLAVPRFNREIGQQWANYIGVRYGLSCASGTAALTIAMEAMDIGPGDEVIVPGMTWVACPQTVYNLGAVPILVDIDPKTLCICPKAARAAITPRTKAIMVVHAYCSLADMDAFTTLANETGIALLEDCSQAHGAKWRAKNAGSFGLISVFSTQQSKLLTSGEGGLCCTNDASLYLKLQQLRTDGQAYSDVVNPDNWMSLASPGSTQGRNFDLSEVSAAILLDGLTRLDDESVLRCTNLEYLEHLLKRKGDVEVIPILEGVTQRAIWRLVFRLNPISFGGCDIARVGRAITAELGLPVEPIDRPFNQNPLYQPLLVPRISRRPDSQLFDPARFQLPNAADQQRRCLAAPHFCLLGEFDDMEDIAEAFTKVSAHANEL